jgi:hypothetical protein
MHPSADVEGQTARYGTWRLGRILDMSTTMSSGGGLTLRRIRGLG